MMGRQVAKWERITAFRLDDYRYAHRLGSGSHYSPSTRLHDVRQALGTLHPSHHSSRLTCIVFRVALPGAPAHYAGRLWIAFIYRGVSGTGTGSRFSIPLRFSHL